MCFAVIASAASHTPAATIASAEVWCRTRSATSRSGVGDHVRPADPDVGEAEQRLRLAVRRLQLGDAAPGFLATSATPAPSSLSAGHDDDVGLSAVRNETLLAVSTQPSPSRRRDDVAVLAERGREDNVAGRNARQQVGDARRARRGCSTYAVVSVATAGTGATARPTASKITASSRKPRPAPPYSSGTAMPVRPAAASCFHSPRSKTDCARRLQRLQVLVRHLFGQDLVAPAAAARAGRQ